MRRAHSGWVRDNGLSLTLFALFALTVVGHALTGQAVWNEELTHAGREPLPLFQYLASGQFGSTLFENWESEFLQMAAYVVLTAYLFQRGSPESKDPDKAAPQDKEPNPRNTHAPWPVRAGKFVRGIYAHSLGGALFIIFLVSFVLHAVNSARLKADENVLQGLPPPTFWQHLSGAELWFESFQNWQSEFLSTAVLIVLAIYLREKGSPESKPVGASHEKTGTD